MEAGFRLDIFDPSKGQEGNKTLTFIHQAEQKLYDDIRPNKFIEGETEQGDPIWADAEKELGPEIDVEEKVFKHQGVFQDLAIAYNDCIGSGGKFSFRIDADAYNYFGDAASIDRYFLTSLSGDASKILQQYQVKAIMLFYEAKYYGHVWYFTNPDYPELCGIYGMKTSLVNLLYGLSCPKSDSSNHRRGIALRILTNGIYPLARKEGRKILVVPWPLPPMIPILQREGFQEHNTTETNEIRRFLANLTFTSNYFTKAL